MKSFPRLVIAGTRGGSGKTTLALGLIAALRVSRGLKVAPFKKGPDYIDAGWLSVAADRPCYNLDPFLIPKEKILASFLSHFSGDVAIVEGNRGLHDGMDSSGSYSTGELAKLLRAPVVLIVDCTKMTRTAAAVVLGCMSLDREVAVRGVVLNQVSTPRHEAVIRESVEKHCGVPVLGAIPRMSGEEFPERHLGLTPHQEHPDTLRALSFARGVAEKHIDLDGLLRIAYEAPPLDLNGEPVTLSVSPSPKSVRIGVLRDAAFQFYYPDNLEELERQGAALVEINALGDSGLPGIDALYIGGGFPETNAVALADNGRFRAAVGEAAERGLPIYAECGGLMFLGERIIMAGEEYPMAGVLPLTFEMYRKPQAHGYTVVEVDAQNPFYPVGTVFHGHEFHYSSVVDFRAGEGVHTAFHMRRGRGISNRREGICYKNVLGTYTHVHALGAEEWTRGLILRAKEYKERYG